MRVRVDEDALGSAMRDECLVDIANRTALFNASVELAVRECAGTTFAKALVGVLDDGAFFENGTEIEASRRGVLAAL